MKKEIKIKDLIITVEEVGDQDYVSLTDIAKQSERRSGDVIRDWLRNSQTLIFLEEWEKIHNPNFKGGHMPTFRLEAQKNRKLITPQRFIEETKSIGLVSISGRYGGTFAHRDIALHFCNWFEPVFYVYMIKAFQQLIEEKYNARSLKWHLTKITDNVDEIRNLLDTIPGQDPMFNRLKLIKKFEKMKQAGEEE